MEGMLSQSSKEHNGPSVTRLSLELYLVLLMAHHSAKISNFLLFRSIYGIFVAKALEESIQAEREAALKEIRRRVAAAEIAAKFACGQASPTGIDPQELDASSRLKVGIHAPSVGGVD